MFQMILREMTMLMAQIHGMLMRINDGFELQLGDKDWHFIVMAALAMALFFVVHFVFVRLAKWSVTAISFIYVFTVMTVLGFAIEIGQRVTKTGNMEFADIMFGVIGFFAMFGIFCFLRAIYHGILRLIRDLREKDSRKSYSQMIEEEFIEKNDER